MIAVEFDGWVEEVDMGYDVIVVVVEEVEIRVEVVERVFAGRNLAVEQKAHREEREGGRIRSQERSLFQEVLRAVVVDRDRDWCLVVLWGELDLEIRL